MIRVRTVVVQVVATSPRHLLGNLWLLNMWWMCGLSDSYVMPHMTRNADLMYDLRPPSIHRSRIIRGDLFIKIGQFVEKIDLRFHSRTDIPVPLYDVSFVPDLRFTLFYFHVVQER